MYLRFRLLHYMRRAGIGQKEVVDRFIERIERSDDLKHPRRTTVLSQLSRLVRREDPRAARFFFRNETHGGALFDSLDVPEWERSELAAAAEEIIHVQRR